MKLLELFAGSRSVGKEAEKLGFLVYSVDIKPFEKVNWIGDILEFTPENCSFIPNVIWASPPCTTFSIAAISHHRKKIGKYLIAKSEAAKNGDAIILKTLEIIEYYRKLNPKLIFFIENPRGGLRKMSFMNKYNMIRHTITYCQYGDKRMKPTDIWTNSETWQPRPICKNGDKCHEAAPRGSRTGTQGLKDDFNRSIIPPELCREILLSLNSSGTELA